VPRTNLALLAEPDRMRIFAAIVLGAATAAEVAARTGLGLRDVVSGVRRLVDGGLVADDPSGLSARTEPFAEIARDRAQTPAEPLDPDRVRASVLAAFIADGRLKALPAGWSKRRIVLEHIAATFEPGVRYPEREVDAILRAWHDDHVTLRRHLVDEDLLTRERGVYWRIGGPVAGLMDGA
jgi:hypothetical protein